MSWGGGTPTGLLSHNLPPAAMPAQQGDLGKASNLPQLRGSLVGLGGGATGRSRRWGPRGEHANVRRGAPDLAGRFTAIHRALERQAGMGGGFL